MMLAAWGRAAAAIVCSLTSPLTRDTVGCETMSAAGHSRRTTPDDAADGPGPERANWRGTPRCGTSFLMVVMLVAILLFSVIKFDWMILNLVVRIALMPVVAGLSYEIIRYAAKKESGAIFKLMTLPGLWLQNITTQEPDESQLEVAIEALNESLKLEPQTA